MREEHYEVLKTLEDQGLIDKDTSLIVRHQMINMNDAKREEHLKRLIKSCSAKAKSRT